MTLPNALVGGAPKCGTTSLADALAGHPDVFIPYKKELSFFHADSSCARGLDWYESFFRRGAERAVRLEATPDYLASAIACERIRRHIPGCRLIFVLRDPVARAHSHYWFRARSGREPRTFLQAVRDEKRAPTDPAAYLIRYGQYATQLRRYFDAFPRHQVLTLRFSSLHHDATATLDVVQSFLGLRAVVTDLPKSNAASQPRSEAVQSVVSLLTRHQGFSKHALRAVVPQSLRYRVRQRLTRLNAKPADKPPIDDEARKILIDAFADQLDDLDVLLETRFDEWRANWSSGS